MLFNSLGFLFLFFPLVLLVSLRLRGQALLRWITLSSFVFYAFAGHVWFLAPMLVTTVLDFYLAPRIAGAASPGGKKALLLLSLSGNLGLLFYFKYAGLFARTLTAVTGTAGTPAFLDVILPAGISFYTFQTMSYIIDVYRGQAKPELNFWKFACFVSFFPHLVAGPLTRHNQLIPGLTKIADRGIAPRWREGVFLFCVGLSKKVLIADRIANQIDPMIDGLALHGAAGAWLALLGYALQIYFDFSGYSDMAIGLARLFDIDLPVNFNSPYQALNPSDFWRRWHITLSTWLRDYLYISLGGNRCSERRRDFNLMTTMVLGGLWHGANWTFAAWGFYHGLLLIVHQRGQRTWDSWPAGVQRGLTFVLVCLGWVFFRAPTFADARTWFAALAGARGLDAGALAGPHKLLALLGAGLGLAIFGRNAVSYGGFARLRPTTQVALAALTVVSIVYMNQSSRFLYFQF